MMVVVVLVGILATLAVFGVRKYILAAKSGEAVSMMTSIKSAQEAFKDETFVYLNVSEDFGSGKWYPTTTPGASKVQWGANTGQVALNWTTLGVVPDGPVQFAYAVVATGPGVSPPAPPTVKQEFGLPGKASQWMYIAAAKSDLGGRTGVYTMVLSHSLSSEVYVENEGE
jgi:type II secretory pathway pseudopilin PulG